MTCRSSIFNDFCLLMVSAALWMSCSSAPDGFEMLDEQVSKKLHSFGSGDLQVGQSQYILLRWEQQGNMGDTLRLLQEALVDTGALAGIVINSTIHRDIQSMEDGAMLEYWAPAAAFKGGSGMDKKRYKVTIEKCFADKRAAAHFLATSAAEGLRSEEECMDLFTALYPELHWMAFNDLRLGFKTRSQGDSVLADRNVHIAYNTFLLGGEQLDSLTEMEFPFGKSGQLLPAMQWGLSKMRAGEEAIILTPSQWAFGQEGSPENKIPAHTPLFWNVKVLAVQTN